MAGMEPVAEPCLSRGAATRLALLLVHAGTTLAASAEAHLAPVDLDGRGYSILSIIESDDPGSQQEIARLLGKAPALVVSAIDDLEARGLVERTRDPQDRRRSRVTLTAAGRRTLRRAHQLADEAVAALLPGLDADELDELRALLARGLGLTGATGGVAAQSA